MGATRFGPPPTIVLALKQQLNATHFIETGTFLGTTAVWASEHFEQVITIEAAAAIHASASATHRQHGNIEFCHGDSRTLLPRLVAQLATPAIFWLDAHWSGGETHGVDEMCPVLDEIACVLASPLPHVILIDDARLFMSPPPLPHQIAAWPTLRQLLIALPNDYYSVIFEDVLIAVPPQLETRLAELCQRLVSAEKSPIPLYRKVRQWLKR